MRAKLWSVRIFRARDWHLREREDFGLKQDHVLGFDVEVTLGAIPDAIDRAFRRIGPTLKRGLGKDTPTEDLESFFRLELDKELFTCVRVIQNIDIDPSPVDYPLDREWFWFDPSQGAERRERFKRDSAAVLDGVVGLVFAQLGERYLSLQVATDYVFIERPDSVAQPILRELAPSVRPISFRPFEEIPSFALAGVFPLTKDKVVRGGKAGQWVSSVLAEDDDFKRFMWAYSGLEAIAGQWYRANKNEARGAIKVLTDTEISGAVVENLLWPSPQPRNELDQRSIIFRFTLMASFLDSEESNDDLEEFKYINEFRNKIHGSVFDPDEVKVYAHRTTELFLKYAGLTARGLIL